MAKRILNKQENAEDWCFECKDGGELIICDHEKCFKAYHPACVGKDDSFLTSDERLICEWHTCLVCKERSADFHCYCCKRAACERCIGLIDFVHLKEEYGFCNDCLKLALLVEEDRNVDSDGESVDLRDRETYEGLFREYYEILKEKEGFDKNILLAGKAQLDKERISRIRSSSVKCSEEEAEQISSDDGDLSDRESQKKRLKKKRCTQQKTKMQRGVKSEKKEFVEWGSKALIDFLQSIGQDTREKLSPFDVKSIVTNYVKEHNLIQTVQKRRILCDVQLQAVFGKKVVKQERLFSLLKSHFVETEEQSRKDELDNDLEANDTEMLVAPKSEEQPQKDELDNDVEDSDTEMLVAPKTEEQSQKDELVNDLKDNDTEMLVAPKTEKKVEQNKISSMWYSTTAQSQYAAVIPENIKLVYLKRSLVLEMIKHTESIETKIIGSFVRVKLDPCDYEPRNSHRLVQITGIKHESSDKCNSESSIRVSNMAKDICLTMLSDDEFSKEECDDLREKVKAGLLKKLTIVELEHKAKILHEDITKHRIARELALLQKLIDRANEKGWRNQFFHYVEKRKHLQEPRYLSSMLQNIPRVIPEEIELESLDRNDNQMHQCSDEMKQNIPEKVELEPLAQNEKDVEQMDHDAWMRKMFGQE